ncbi:putative reverse transcriptase domain-containing protein [Tanacetum coccineum]
MQIQSITQIPSKRPQDVSYRTKVPVVTPLAQAMDTPKVTFLLARPQYHPLNRPWIPAVADALSRKDSIKPRRIKAINMTLPLSIKDKILAAQEEAYDEPARLQRGLDKLIEHRSNRALYYLDRIWVPLKGYVRTLIMDKAYKSKYSVHLGVDKMYYDLMDMYWWLGMKKNIAVYVSRCLTCLKVKAED